MDFIITDIVFDIQLIYSLYKYDSFTDKSWNENKNYLSQ